MDILQLDRRGGLLAHHAMILTYASIAVPVETPSSRPQRACEAPRRGLRRYGRGFLLVQSAAAIFATALLFLVGSYAMASAQASSTSPTAARPLKLVAFGDSLSAGYNLPGSAAFPAVLEQALRRKGLAIEIVNAGVSGDTTQAGLERLDWSVPDGTDGVILELGANDALRGVDPAQTRKALEAMITRLKGRGIPVMLAGMYAPRNLGPDYAKSFDAIHRELAEKHGLVLYPFFLEGIAGDRALNQPDGLHPTAEGVNVIVRNILPTVERFIASLPARS
jgi:acyl-CoA thioesterase-1